jgi:hypothetical protein
MMSETGYFFMSIYAAVKFIEDLTVEQLVIDPEIFLRYLL